MTKYIVPLCQSFGAGLSASWRNRPETSPANDQLPSQTLLGLERLTQAMERLAGREPVAALSKQIAILAESVVQRPHSAVAGIAPECLSREDAAVFLGVPVKTVEYLITSRKLRYVQVGQQRGRSIAVADLKKFAEENTVKTADEMLAKHRRH